MKTNGLIVRLALLAMLATGYLHAYESLQGPTEVLYLDAARAYPGYTWFGARGKTYLLDMEGRVVHTWPIGTNPHLLPNGNVLDAAKDDPSGFGGFIEVDWSGAKVWQYTESRAAYAPHHDFLRIFNPKLKAYTTLYIANKTITQEQAIAAGCDPANGPYTGAQMDAIVEVDPAGSIVWEWWFFDHVIQDLDATKANYVSAGKSIADYPGRLNLNQPGRPLRRDWLHCNSIDYHPALDQIVVNSVQGEFYVVDHGNTFIAGDPTASIALAATAAGDFRYRFGDPARYEQGDPPSVLEDWTASTTGHKQIGGSHHVSWIPAGLPGAGHFLVFNNGQYLFERTPQSYIFEINPYLNASTNDTGAYVNPPTAGYNRWESPNRDTHKQTKNLSRQVTWMYYSKANQACFSHIGSSAQRLPNGNTLICADTEGHIFEVTSGGEVVWEYISPVSSEGIVKYKRDNWPMFNSVFRAFRIGTNDPALAGRTLVAQDTITGRTPSYVSTPAISGTSHLPVAPTATDPVWVASTVTHPQGVAQVTLTYLASGRTNAVAMLDDGAHGDGVAGDGRYGGLVPALPGATTVRYYVAAQNEFGNTALDPTAAPVTTFSYLVQSAAAEAEPDVLLGRPTDHSVAASVLAGANLEAYLEYGTTAGVFSRETPLSVVAAGTPAVLTMDSLLADTSYRYRLRYRVPGGAEFSAGAEHGFRTQRVPTSAFTFVIESDPHFQDTNATISPSLWQLALRNMLADQPDFLINLGDTFMDEKVGVTGYAGAAGLRAQVRTNFFSILGHSVPLFLAGGNHDAELGWLRDGTTNSLPVWGATARGQYFPAAEPGAFYSVGAGTEADLGGPRNGFYSFSWGNALFVVLDPFWYTAPKPGQAHDLWGWTLGASQYAWLQETLAESRAALKFVFVHHLVGGSADGLGRGGVELAPYGEWGGYHTNGVYEFAARRPGWAMPIQSLLLTHGVSAVFHGHDHLFARQEVDANGDGIAELLYQACPQPSATNYSATGNAASYGYTNGTILGNAGHLRVTVTPTNATVAYVRAFLPVHEGAGRTNRMVSAQYTLAAPTVSDAVFPGTVIPGRPTEDSLAVNVLTPMDLQVYLEHGTTTGVYSSQTTVQNLVADEPAVLELTGLPADTRCYYRLRFRNPGAATFQADLERTFRTARVTGSTFTFDIQSDSHLYDRKGDPTLYRVTQENIRADAPDFLLDLGDTFGDDHEPTTITAAEMELLHVNQRPFFAIAGEVAPLFLCLGNHEGETIGYESPDTTANPICTYATQARLRHYPNPFPGAFYSGNTNADVCVHTNRIAGLPGNYYAWEWGDALFVVLDAYRYLPAAKPADLWDWTLGQAQYDWFKRTLESSSRRYKFVFAHHVLGQTRGGTAWADRYEWGGRGKDGAWEFAARRPGWALPLHQLMVTNGVTVFFQGHDHLFAREERDGLVYQEVPMPSDATYHVGDEYAGDYTGVVTNNSGHLRVTVSPSGVAVDYVRAFLPADETATQTNRMVGYRYTVKPAATDTGWTMRHLPDTGQTSGYTATFGEDSDYAGPTPSFTKGGDGTVTDNVTGLVWQQTDGGEMTWEAAVTYASALVLGGQSDWRLPTSHELFSILNHGAVNPAFDTNVFTATPAQYWWTADVQPTDATRVWAANAGGGIGPHPKTETVSAGGAKRFHVRCVRGVAAPTRRPIHSFRSNSDGTVTDLDTGLVWQAGEVASAGTWEAALQQAEALSLAGQTDWRLPNLKELRSLNDETLAGPSLDTNYFPDAKPARYWSSTTEMNGTNRAWFVDFQLGIVGYDNKLTNLWMRCVRGGVTTPPPATNTFSPEFVRIPAGTFEMGDHQGFVDPEHPSDEIPVHAVYVDAFDMSTTLLTCREYCDFLNAALGQGLIEWRAQAVYGAGSTNLYCDTVASDPASRLEWTGSQFVVRDQRDLHPVTGVRWFGAIGYCNWASVRDGLTPCYNLATGACDPAKNGYRLPSEAEWEYAARGGLHDPYRVFPWGDDSNADGTLANWPASGDPYETGPHPWTTPVTFYDGQLHAKADFNWPGTQATYQTRSNANGYGLQDMSGNVWQWVNDWYAKDYYTYCLAHNVVTNPPGPSVGDPMPDGLPYRGLRGGNWFNGQEYYGHGRVANRDPSYYRGPGDPNGPWFHVGFRPVRSVRSLTTPGAVLTPLASGLHFTEGPAADASGNVFFSDVPGDTIYQWSVSNQLTVFRRDSGGANGLFFDQSGNLLACEGDNGQLVSLSPQGEVNVVANNYGGLRFNEPNDLWVDPAGGVYFSDPVYFGHPVVQGGEHVYYLKPDRSAVLRVVSDMVRPNGLVGTPDGRALYVADWGATNVFRYDIHADGTLGAKTPFAAVRCDGMTLDRDGNLYLTEGAVLVYDPDGRRVEAIHVPERPTHVEFGGSDRQTLFITTDAGSLYSIRMQVAGIASGTVPTNRPPVIANTTITPALPTSTDPVWVTARVTDDASVRQVSLAYLTGAGAGRTNTVFLETMRATAVKPWTGDGCQNPWTVTFTGGNPFEQRGGANYGGGNTNGLEFKGGTATLTDSMVASTQPLDTRGESASIEFWLWANGLSGTAGWTFQLDSGSGYVTRLSELTGTNHNWQPYHYDLQPSERVANLKLRWQFRGGQPAHRIDLDQISLKVGSAGSSATTVPMLDDGAHRDGVAGDGAYGAQIPAQPVGTAVNYYLTATDNAGAQTTDPPGAPSLTRSYIVQTGPTNVVQTVGLFTNDVRAFEGYTLMAPKHHTNTYLINNAGEIVNRWTSRYEPGQSAYLLPNGHLLRCAFTKNGALTGGGEGGRLEEYDWDGTLVWELDYATTTEMSHHDITPLPNGNVLMLVVEKKSYAEVLAAGFNPALLHPDVAGKGYMLPDSVIEVQPTLPRGGNIVWEWHVWDHLIQDFSPAQSNYGVVAEHPELVNVNGWVESNGGIMPFWNHMNSIAYHPGLDQVVLSVRGSSELWVIDHGTTSAEAAGHTGGPRGRGGDLLYRWGNPITYGRGTAAKQMLFDQHDAQWIDPDCPGAGHLLIFNNGLGRNYSTVDEITPPLLANGLYSIAATSAYEPAALAWTYRATPPSSMYSEAISGAQRLPNGNTLMCDGVHGILTEVTAAGETVWRYVCPVAQTGPLTQGQTPGLDDRGHQYNAVFKVRRYPADYPGLLGKDLTSQGPVELPVDQTLRFVTLAADTTSLKMSWASLPGKDYVVQHTADLGALPWTNIGSVSSLGTVSSFEDTDPARLARSRGFYQVILER